MFTRTFPWQLSCCPLVAFTLFLIHHVVVVVVVVVVVQLPRLFLVYYAMVTTTNFVVMRTFFSKELVWPCFSLSLDIWTSSNQHALAIVMCYINSDWKCGKP